MVTQESNNQPKPEISPPMREKKNRSLTPDAFQRLLACLNADPAQAAAKYEDLRQSLITFFAFRQVEDPHALADETFNRVAFRLSEGQEITTNNPAYYFYAVARNVWREQLAQPQTLVPLSDALATTATRAPSVEELRLKIEEQTFSEQRLQCLEQCLARLTSEDNTILLEYHQGQGRAKIERRQAQADRLGITIRSLRNRACRIRERLADCIQDCLPKQER
jgi:DNA-directed RNA polymerase specialized sigma24 family protein